MAARVLLKICNRKWIYSQPQQAAGYSTQILKSQNRWVTSPFKARFATGPRFWGLQKPQNSMSSDGYQNLWFWSRRFLRDLIIKDDEVLKKPPFISTLKLQNSRNSESDQKLKVFDNVESSGFFLIPRVNTPRSCLGEDSSVGLGSCPRV